LWLQAGLLRDQTGVPRCPVPLRSVQLRPVPRRPVPLRPVPLRPVPLRPAPMRLVLMCLVLMCQVCEGFASSVRCWMAVLLRVTLVAISLPQD